MSIKPQKVIISGNQQTAKILFWGWWHHNLKKQTLADQRTTRVIKFYVDA